jgi:hypothetical protein
LYKAVSLILILAWENAAGIFVQWKIFLSGLNIECTKWVDIGSGKLASK